MPVLELDDGTQLVQTRAILSYIGAKYNLKPTDAMEDYRGQVAECLYLDDYMAKIVPPLFAKEGREEKIKNIEEVIIPEFLKKFETLLSDDRKFLCNDTLSIYDIGASGLFTNIILNPNSKDPEVWARVWETVSPRIKKWVADIQEELKDYFAKRAEQTCTM